MTLLMIYAVGVAVMAFFYGVTGKYKSPYLPIVACLTWPIFAFIMLGGISTEVYKAFRGSN